MLFHQHACLRPRESSLVLRLPTLLLRQSFRFFLLLAAQVTPTLRKINSHGSSLRALPLVAVELDLALSPAEAWAAWTLPLLPLISTVIPFQAERPRHVIPLLLALAIRRPMTGRRRHTATQPPVPRYLVLIRRRIAVAEAHSLLLPCRSTRRQVSVLTSTLTGEQWRRTLVAPTLARTRRRLLRPLSSVRS